MLRIGLTGGIGSGKTTVAKIFEILAVPVYYADAAAKRLMKEDPVLRERIIAAFGQKSYTYNELNRSYLAEVVFSDPEKTKLINSFIHPATLADAAKWMDLQKGPYAVKEAALIFEAGTEKHLDLVIGVQAPFELRMQRAMQRDSISEAAVLSRMEKQMDEAEKMSRCDILINNDEKELLIPQVIAVHEQLLKNIERLHC